MHTADDPISSHVGLHRTAWARLRRSTPLTLTEADLDRLRGIGDPVDIREVVEIYLPLARLLNMYVAATRELHKATSGFLGAAAPRTPFVIGIAGSVAVGKSTAARVLRELLARWPKHREVSLVTTDGFLLPLAELQSRGLLQRKGFPESYDQRALLRFVASVKAGVDEVRAPVYSHLTYDIVPGEWQTVSRPNIVIVEGLNVLQTRTRIAVSDFFDFSIYIDAAADDVRRWYIERFLTLRESAFADPRSYFRRYAALGDTEAAATADRIWREINEPNLIGNIQPTRGRATVVLRKDADHAVRSIRLRRW